MNYKDYNADSICHSVGLNQLINGIWAANETTAIRVVMKPSFHHEVITTATKTKSNSLISMVAASIHVWSLDFPKPTKSFSDQADLDGRAFLEFIQSFDLAYKESQTPSKIVCIDGMSIETCFVENSRVEKFAAHVSANKLAGELAAQLIKLAWEVSCCPEVKNALSIVAGYAGLKIPQVQPSDPPSKPHVGILILGAPEEKAILSKAIENHGKHGKR